MADYLQPGGDLLQHLGDVLAQRREMRATAGGQTSPAGCPTSLRGRCAGRGLRTAGARASRGLALQLPFCRSSESIGNHDSGHDEWRRVS